MVRAGDMIHLAAVGGDADETWMMGVGLFLDLLPLHSKLLRRVCFKSLRCL